MKKTNYHTHCAFCDGKQTAEENVLAAIDKKFDALGFSSHSMLPFSSDWHLGARSHGEYASEILRLKEKYAEKIEICLGFEADYIAGVCAPSSGLYEEFAPDYIIGSVHFVPGKKGFIEADGSGPDTRAGIEKYFGGDARAAVCEYFRLEREMLSRGGFTFLGHPDLIRKQNVDEILFDESEEWYKNEIRETARAIARSGVCVEVNTGGILRCGMSEPYPSPFFLSLLRELNVAVTFSSDAHSVAGLDFWFDEAAEYIRKAGYSEAMFLSAGSLKSQKI